MWVPVPKLLGGDLVEFVACTTGVIIMLPRNELSKVANVRQRPCYRFERERQRREAERTTTTTVAIV